MYVCVCSVFSILFVNIKCLHMLCGRPICSTFAMFIRSLVCARSLSLHGSFFLVCFYCFPCVRVCFLYTHIFSEYTYCMALPFEFFIRTTFNGSSRGRSSRSENWIDGLDSKVDECKKKSRFWMDGWRNRKWHNGRKRKIGGEREREEDSEREVVIGQKRNRTLAAFN